MKVAIVAPEPVPPMLGGTERAVSSMRRAIDQTGLHEAELVKLPVDESNLPDLIDAYERFATLDVSEFDRVISVKYPAWMISHPDHIVYMFHPLRGLYDAYDEFGLPLIAEPHSDATAQILSLIGHHNDRGAVEEFFARFRALVAAEGRDAPDLAFPGPFARAIVHWLDHIALTPPRATRHFMISATIAGRPEYLPRGLRPRVLPLPTDLPNSAPNTEPGTCLFTASRLAEPKRIGLLIDAMQHVQSNVSLKIAGTGPLDAELRALAASDPRIQFLGFVPDDELIDHYRNAIAVPFVPIDEDQGLICVEAASQGTPVITCTDSGGPTEFVADGVNGLVCQPTAEHLGRALGRVAADPIWARRMGRAAHRRTTVRTWRQAVDALLDGSAPNPSPSTPPTPVDRPEPSTSPRFGRRPRAVVLATYGIDRPGHGGALRVLHLCRALASIMDIDVLALTSSADDTSTAVEIAPGLRSTSIPRSAQQARIEDDLGKRAGQPITDIYAGVDAHLTPAFGRSLRDLTDGADLVVLAHPFLYPALQEAHIDLPFVMDAHNVEIDLRTHTLAESPAAGPILDLLARIERDALRGARLVSSCSRTDADRLAQLYDLDRAAIAVIPNGSEVPVTFRDAAARRRARKLWFERFHWTWGSPRASELAVFFGSWHPPNLDAAEFLVEVAATHPELFIVSAGNHGTPFADRTLPANIIFPGVVSEIVKTALLNCASIALNPMRFGSGTNLKLIEFLGHGVPTVSTPFGARGLDLTNGRELILAEREDFPAAIRRVLDDPVAASKRSLTGWEVAQGYDWNRVGTDFAAMVADVLAG